METTKINGILKSLANAKAKGKLNIILSAPKTVVNATTNAPVNGVVGTSSKLGEAIIKTDFGDLRLFSSIPLLKGENVLLYSKGFGEHLTLRVLPIGQGTHATAVSAITNDMSDGKESYSVFRMPNHLKDLAKSVGNNNVSNVYSGVVNQAIGQSFDSYHMDPLAGSIIAFLSYLHGEKFNKNLKKSLPKFMPNTSENNFGGRLSKFIKNFSSFEGMYKVTEEAPLDGKIKTDLVNLGQTCFQLQGESWKLSIVPIFNGSQTIITRFMSKKAEDQDEDSDSIPSKRFFIDFDFDIVGKVLIDGLVSYTGKVATSTLVVKSQKRFPDILEEKISQITNAINSISGIPTSVTFHKLQQSDPDPFSDILQEYYKGKINSLRV